MIRVSLGVLCLTIVGSAATISSGCADSASTKPAAGAGSTSLVGLDAGNGGSADEAMGAGTNSGGSPSNSSAGTGTGDAGSAGELETSTSGPGKATGLSLGEETTCVTVESGGVWCWGGNNYGLLGSLQRSVNIDRIPAEVAGLTSEVTSIALGALSETACVVTAGGAVKCWGDNSVGQLGQGTSGATSSFVPVQVPGLTSGVTAVSVGENSACAIVADGSVQCWGRQYSPPSISKPVQIAGLNGAATAISVGGDTVCAITAGGAVQCWGNNGSRQLGNAATTGSDSSVPVQVDGLTSGASAISVGGNTACAITAQGGVKCWGLQFGTAVTLADQAPSDVQGLTSGVVAISAGAFFACAVTAAGGVECWGDNSMGQLGNGMETPVLTAIPAPVSGLSSGVVSVSVGGNYLTSGESSACALTKEGRVLCWGDNGWGQLGDGSTTSSSTPVTVKGF